MRHTDGHTARHTDGERGVTSVEVMGSLPWLLIAVAVVWQLLLLATTATSVENAARNAGIQHARGASVEEVRDTAVDSVPPWLREGADAVVSGQDVTVSVAVPIVAPGLTRDDFVMRRTTTFPDQ